MGILAKVPTELRVKQERIRLGLRQREVAEQCGVAQGAISEMEGGKRQPWPALRASLAVLYGVDEGELFADMTWWEFKLPAQRLPRMPVFKPKGAE